MSDLSALSYYLGIEVKQGKEKVTLGQRAYALKLLERAGMTGCKPMATPMEERLKLSKDSTAARVDATRYQSIVGGLWWLTHTRPDIVFAVGYVSRFLEDPREDHWTVVKRLKYLANAGFNCHEDFESGDDTEDDEISPSPLPSEHKAKRPQNDTSSFHAKNKYGKSASTKNAK